MSRVSRIRRATTIASSFAIALGIGFVMQYGDASAARYTSNDSGAVQKPVLIIDYSPIREMTHFALKPERSNAGDRNPHIPIDPNSVKLVALVDDLSIRDGGTLFAQTQPQTARSSDCEVRAVTAPDSHGSVVLTVISGCRPDMPFSVNHGGVTFSAETNDKGMSMLTVPAMSVDATFFITFEDGKSLATSTYVPNAERYNRVVFQWEGHPGTYLQETANMSSFGKVARLGDDVGEIPRFVDIYSFPASLDLTDGLNGIDLVASVTDHNCGQDLIAESFTIFPGVVGLTFKDIRITLPSCDALGDTISLKKILGEQTLAAK